MRVRALLASFSVLSTGLALLAPLPAAHAVRPAAPVASGPAAPVERTAAPTTGPITLPTGERVRLSGPSDRRRVVVQPSATSGAGRTLMSHRLGSRDYVWPAVAEAYLGRSLDPALFDLARLQQTEAAGGRIPVRVSYSGSTPKVPGIHLVSAAGGVARGYLSTRSAAAFGRALAAQWQTDTQAGWPRRTGLFPGVTRIAADGPRSGTARPSYPMKTLVIKVVGRDGLPLPRGVVDVINVDDASHYAGWALVEDGEARVSVPAGTYSALSDDFTYDRATDTGSLAVTTVNEFVVTTSGQTLGIDHRGAVVRPRAVAPDPTRLISQTFEWVRSDAADSGDYEVMALLEDRIDLRVTPSAPARVGALSVAQAWTLGQPGTTQPGYRYDLATVTDRIPAEPDTVFRRGDLATIASTYYGEGGNSPAGVLRLPLFDESGGGGLLEPVTRGTNRLEYAGARPATTWADVAAVNLDSADDPGFFEGPERNLQPGSTSTATWFHGPLAPAVPVQQDGGFCYACRAGNHISLGLAPVTDSDPQHLGDLINAEDALTVARFRVYRDGRLLVDEDDAVGASFSTRRGAASYRAVLDVDRRLTDPVLSTRSRTELTFTSARDTGQRLPKGWYCRGSSCRVLPVLQARLGLPTDLQGRLPAGPSTVTVSAAAVSPAPAVRVTSARLEVRPAGFGWTSVPLTAGPGGVYTGVLDNTDLEGSTVDTRITATAAGGSSTTQTVVRAYSVAPS